MDQSSKNLELALSAFGVYLIACSSFETAVDAALTHALELSSIRGEILTASLNHKAKSSILSSLLHHEKHDNWESIDRTLRQYETESKRNKLVHSHIILSNNQSILGFISARASSKYKAELNNFGARELTDLAANITRMTIALVELMGLTAKEIDAFTTERFLSAV